MEVMYFMEDKAVCGCSPEARREDDDVKLVRLLSGLDAGRGQARDRVRHEGDIVPIESRPVVVRDAWALAPL